MKDDKKIVEISLVILTFNRREGLRRCLDSILKMEKRDIRFEVIVVDDGSKTDNISIINQFNGSLDVRYFKKDNEGVASTRNFGLRAARGDLVAFIADDYRLPENYLPDVMDFFDANPHAYVITHNINPTGPSIFRYVQRLYFQMTLLQRFDDRDLGNDVVKSLELPPSRGAVFRKELFRLLGNFNEDFLTGEDGEFGMRMASADMPVYFFMHKYIDHWEDKGLQGYLCQRIRYGGSYYRALKAQNPDSMGKQSLGNVLSSTIERYYRWLKLSYKLRRGPEYLALSPFIILFLMFYYGSFYSESKKTVVSYERQESGISR